MATLGEHLRRLINPDADTTPGADPVGGGPATVPADPNTHRMVNEDAPRTGDGHTGSTPTPLTTTSQFFVNPTEAAGWQRPTPGGTYTFARGGYIPPAPTNLPEPVARIVQGDRAYLLPDIDPAATAPAAATDADRIARSVGSREPAVGRPYPIPKLTPEGPTVTDPAYFDAPTPDPADTAVVTTNPGHPVTCYACQGTGADVCPTCGTGTAECPTCQGTGTVTRTVNELLRDTVAAITDPDALVRDFYTRLLSLDNDKADGDKLGPLFPADLLDGDTTHGQRDRLIQAILALSELYDPDRPASLTRLETALRAFGRQHAAFTRPDGTVRAATVAEYADVKTCLFPALAAAVAVAALTPAHVAAWSAAYDDATTVMLDEQRLTRWAATTGPAPYPRAPRTTQAD